MTKMEGKGQSCKRRVRIVIDYKEKLKQGQTK